MAYSTKTDGLTEAKVFLLKARVNELKAELRQLGIRDTWTFFKYYHMDYPQEKFRTLITTQKTDLDFTRKLDAMVTKLKADKKTSIEDKQG